jgi:hypothetical protein
MTIITSDTKKYVTYVVLAIGIFVLFFVTSLFHFYDTSDLSFYASACYYLLHGVLPYYRFIFPYPPLALLPMLLAYPSFPVIFAFEMLICQFIILFCVYEITLHIKPESAFLAALIYSLSLPVWFFTFTRYDSFVVALMMLGFYFMIKQKYDHSLYLIIAAICTKLFPVILLPFLLFHSKFVVKTKLLIFIIVGIVLSVLLYPVTLSILSSDLSRNTYVNTFFYNLNSVNPVLTAAVSLLFALFLACIIIQLFLYISDPTDYRLLRVILFLLVTLILILSYHSPQYILWVLPLMAILVSMQDWKYHAGYFILCFLSFLEYPVFFGAYYVNSAQYTGWIPYFFILYYVVMMMVVI